MRSRDVHRVHLEARDPDHEARAVETRPSVVVAQHVAHVLAQEALDALAELHDPLDILLLHPPRLLLSMSPPVGVNGGICLFTS